MARARGWSIGLVAVIATLCAGLLAPPTAQAAICRESGTSVTCPRLPNPARDEADTLIRLFRGASTGVASDEHRERLNVGSVGAVRSFDGGCLVDVTGHAWQWDSGEYRGPYVAWWTMTVNTTTLPAQPRATVGSYPVPVSGLDKVSSCQRIDSRTYAAIRTDGTVWEWTWIVRHPGSRDRATAVQVAPKRVRGLKNIVSLHRGAGSPVALRANGTVWEWASGKKANKVTALRHIVDVTGDMAVRADGTVWQWGAGPLPTGSGGTLPEIAARYRTHPQRVVGLTKVVQIAGLGDSYYVLRRDGTVWAWGNNYDGSLGDGTRRYRTNPVRVAGLSAVTAISGDSMSMLALRRGGSVWTWGYYAAPGDHPIRRARPIKGLTDVVAISPDVVLVRR